MRKIFFTYMSILVLVGLTAGSAKAVTFDQGNHNVTVSTDGPDFTNGTLGKATIRTTVDVKYRVVYLEFIDLDQAFTRDQEIDFAISTPTSTSLLANEGYYLSQGFKRSVFPANTAPQFCGNILFFECTPHTPMWFNVVQEIFFVNATTDSTTTIGFKGLVHPVEKSPLYTAGYVYAADAVFTGTFITGIVNIAGIEYMIAYPEIVAGDPNISDIDNDGIPDLQDNCLLLPNPAQENLDADIYGDLCDSSNNTYDLTGDGFVNFADVVYLLGFVNPPTFDTLNDLNGDGVVNFGDVVTLLGSTGSYITGPTGI